VSIISKGQDMPDRDVIFSSSVPDRRRSLRRGSLPATGARVAVAEEFRVGGTCVIPRCVPKKLLSMRPRFGRRISRTRRMAGRSAAIFDWTR